MDRQVLQAAETVLKRAPLPCVLYWSARIAIATAIYILLFYTVLVETFQYTDPSRSLCEDRTPQRKN